MEGGQTQESHPNAMLTGIKIDIAAMPDFHSYGLSAEDARLYREQVDNED